MKLIARAGLTTSVIGLFLSVAALWAARTVEAGG